MTIFAAVNAVIRIAKPARRGSGFAATLAAALVVCGSVVAAEPVKLPQDHEYQAILRNYIGSLAVKDFDVPLEPIDFREQWFRDDESLHRMWVLAQSFPEPIGLLLAPENFLLREIESPQGIRIRIEGQPSPENPGVTVHPEDTVWWSTWDYRANPYRGSRQVRNRAFVVAAVDMIMLDQMYDGGMYKGRDERRSDFLGGQMIWHALVYRDVQSDLPDQVRAAYETGLVKFLDRLTKWGPKCVNDNMDTKALIAMAYLAATFREGPIVDKARAYANWALERFHPAGIIRDAGGLEASYNGLAAFNIAWATAVTPWPEMVTALRRMSDLKAHMTLPEPDLKNFWGPSHFSSRTSVDMANDQWPFFPRDVAIAMHADEALYLMFTGRSGRQPGWGVPTRAAMVTEVKTAVDRVNARLKPSRERLQTWGPSYWPSTTFNFAYEHYTPGFYGLLTRMQAERHPVALPPMVRPGETFIRSFPPQDMPGVAEADRDAFLIARFPTYAAIVYTGPIGWHSYMNFAGGCLSAFWTPESGSVVLGRTGQPVTPENARQTWADWRLWPTHAVSGQTASGDAFSSARIRRRVSKVEYELERHAATVTFAGPIGNQNDESRAAQNGCITGAVRYQRSMHLGPRGVLVETRIESDGKDRVTDLCEIIPLVLNDEQTQATPKDQKVPAVPHRVVFEVGDRLVEPGEGFVDGVTTVRVARFYGETLIRFEEPQRVRLGEAWTTNYQSAMSLRNILVDLLAGRPRPVALPSVSIRYRIEPRPPR